MSENRSSSRVELSTPRQAIVGYQDVVDVIRREIALGRLLPGQRLSAERKLAEQIGVARETVRQALRVLEGSGQIAIERGPNGGAVILDFAMTGDAIRAELRSRREDLLDLLAFRQDIECAAAMRAATRRTEAQLREMTAAQEALLEAPDRDLSRAADTAFHLTIARAADNTRLLIAIENARAEMFYPVDLVTFEFVKETSHDDHRAVLDAIRARDAAAAGSAMAEHIDHTRIEMLALIG